MLARAPDSVVDGKGAPAFGTYQGSISQVDYGALSAPMRPGLRARLLRHKRWAYCFLATGEVAVLGAVVDLTYSGGGFMMAVDLRDGRVLADAAAMAARPLSEVNDWPNEGLRARLRLPWMNVAIERPEKADRFRWTASLWRPNPFPQRTVGLSAELLAIGGAPPLTLVAPVEGGTVNMTQKWSAMLAFGTLRAGGREYLLDGGVGGMDYTNGLLARRTAWRWAFAAGRLSDGTPVGLNLVEGFNEAQGCSENGVWVDRQLYPVGRATFQYNKRELLDPWQVRTDDGAVELSFRPLAVHREERNMKLVQSHFAQPLGLYSGVLKVGGRTVELSGVPGVTEEQDVLW